MKQEKFPQAIREEQGEMPMVVFSDLTGFSPSNMYAWSSGKKVPSEDTINKISEALGWDDDKRMSFMPKLEEKGLIKKVMRHRQRLKLNQTEFAKYMGVAYTTVRKWRKGDDIPEGIKKELVKFLKLSEEDVHHVIRRLEWERAEKEMKKRRVKIPYDIIHKLECRERGFGRMSDAPDDHPELIKLQRYMNSQW